MNTKILIILSLSSFTLFAMTSSDFEQVCRESNGKIYHTICWCDGDLTKAYFDPYFSTCEKDGPRDKGTERSSLIPKNNDQKLITDFASLMASYKDDVCDPDFDRLQQGSIAVLEHALKVRFNTQPSDETKLANTFYDKVVSLWQQIINALHEENRNDPDYNVVSQWDNNTYTDLSSPEWMTYFLKENLRLGIIPLPAFGNDSENLFRTEALTWQALIGIAPVEVDRNSLRGLSNKYPHPFKAIFLSTVPNFASHDFQHGKLLAFNVQRLGIFPKGVEHFHFSSKKCRVFKAAFDEVLSIKNAYGKSKFAMMLYFRLHEGPFFLDSVGSRIAFYEFALERILAKKNETLAHKIFEGTESSSERTQAMCHQILDKMNDKTSATRHDFLKPILDVPSINFSNRKGIGERLTTIELFKRMAQGPDYSWYPKLSPQDIEDIGDDILHKLSLTCKFYGFESTLPSKKEVNSKFDLVSETKRMLQQKSPKSFIEDYEDMIYSQGKLLKEFSGIWRGLSAFSGHEQLISRWSEDRNIWNQVISEIEAQ